ncbi:MAG: ATP synthase F0 subunit B [Nitrospirae bacterium]|nr:ATP synthase F0 subunit B [Nitrospirota bacterium]
MLELNKWFFAQLANFLLLLIILNIVLFKPILQLFKEREKRTKGSLDEAKAMDAEKDNMLAQFDAKITEANEKARGIHGELKNEGARVQKETFEAAQKDAAAINMKAKQDLDAVVKETKNKLRTDVKAFSEKIVEKMVSA